jgi:hypothetical protein
VRYRHPQNQLKPFANNRYEKYPKFVNPDPRAFPRNPKVQFPRGTKSLLPRGRS